MKQLIVMLLIIGIISCQDSNPIIKSSKPEDLTSEQIDSLLIKFNF